MAIFFNFERDFVDSLRCIPMQVRYKLDSCGIKLKLSDWNQMTHAEREALVELPCTKKEEIQFYQEYLQQLVLERTGTLAAKLPIEPHPEWMDSIHIPVSIQEKAQEMDITLTPHQWANLTPLQRFALIKLSRSGHENKNFPRAMAEFYLL
ncbi:nitrate reductase associated protein [aff. Roholtiella sp. LEGE 12411]|uniref:nitrate reductase associated protein n=1 Tax=aff. Roholtiella sp. LEGE 12411 TaxID=1828822 RepID=UPI00187F803E|nr:nitrate reductase associated protein [aff. Roholtiella sp. LEGE 12411]MBE9034116.1 nitrate reductase associated protein [aff. Roholtiella sp. LEGE 12411]